MSDEMEVGRRIAHLERELSTHGSAIVSAAVATQNLERASEERLDYLKERFDRVDARMERADASSKFWTTTALTIIFTAAMAVNYMYIEPVVEKVKALERRVLYVEKQMLRLTLNDEPK